MEGKKIENSKDAQVQFLEQLPGDWEVGLVSFGGGVRLTNPPTTDFKGLKGALKKTLPGGGTPLGEALLLSYMLLSSKEKNIKAGIFSKSVVNKMNEAQSDNLDRRAIVLSSDGKANGGLSNREILDFAKKIKGEGIRLITIAIGDKADKELLKKLVSEEKDYHVAEFSGELSGLYREVASGLILAEDD